jgi:hypothetical protein
MTTRWDVFKQLMLTPDQRKAIGKAWPLFLFIALNSQKDNKLKTSYEELKKVLGEPESTIKKWRDCLVDNKVIEVIPGKLSMTLKLLPPYDSIATCELDDISEIKKISSPGMKQILDKMTSLDSLSVIIQLGKIAEKMGKLEEMIAKGNS